MLEEIHPKLFDAFAAAARTLERAETQEDLAQASISGRRLLEMTADCLFPPQEQPWNGHLVDHSKYANRIWAYIEQTAAAVGAGEPGVVTTLGRELDRLIEEFNTGLHASPTKERVDAAFRDLVLWLTAVIRISPAHASRPYLAYEDQLHDFLIEVLKQNDSPASG
jgi:hypothetical protein